MTIDDRPDHQLATGIRGDRGPEPPMRLDIPAAIRVARGRTRRLRLVGGACVAALTALAVVGLPTAFASLGIDNNGNNVAGSPSPVAPKPSSCRIDTMAHELIAPVVTGADPTGRHILVLTSSDQQYIVTGGKARRVEVPGAKAELTDINSAAVAVATSDAGAWTYNGGKLVPLSGENPRAHAINEQGDVTGTVTVNRFPRPVVWRAGSTTPTTLPLPSSATGGEAFGIADDGTVIGVIDKTGGTYGHVWYPDGRMQELPIPKDISTVRMYARGIHGVWVTGMATLNPSQLKPSHGWTIAVRWNLDSGTAEALPQLHHFDVQDRGNGNGWLVGSHQQGSALLVTPAGDVRLPRLPGALPSSWDVARTVSEDGRVITGHAIDDRGVRRVAIWRCR